jgi:hypothetical protein
MNWIAWDPRSYGGAFLGGILGVFLYGALQAQGMAFPWIVGLLMGLGCAAVTTERSSMRGIVLAIGAAWLSAFAQVHYQPPPGTHGLIEGLRAFHDTLEANTLWAHFASLFAAWFFGRTSFRSGARQRLAGE